MKKSRLKFVILFFLITIGIVSLDFFQDIKGSAQSSAFQLDSIPETIQPCINQEAVNKFLEAGVAYEGQKYFLVRYDATNPETGKLYSRQTVIKDNDLGCLVVIPEHGFLQESLTLYLPEVVARDMDLQRLEAEIQEVGGKQKFEKFLNEGDPSQTEFHDETVYFFPERFWALQQLGIRLPKNLQIIESWEEIEDYPSR